MTLARYAPVSREVRPPRPDCPACKVAMWFDGCYRRKVRQAGVVHELVVHRVRCPRCRAGHAVLPDFVVARRLDSAEVIGAALAAAQARPGRARRRAGGGRARSHDPFVAGPVHLDQPAAGDRLQRAGGRAGMAADGPAVRAPAHTAVAAIGAAWHTTLTRYPASPLRGPWRFANAMCGGALMAIRMSVPLASRPGHRGRSRPP